MALARLVPRPNVRATPSKGKAVAQTEVIALANQKGGVAKTTTTLNLGVALRERGFRVLGVDLDPQSNLSMSQGIDVEGLETTMYDVLVSGVPMAEVIHAREI